MININNYHILHRLSKRTIPLLKKRNKFDLVLANSNSEKNERCNKLIKNMILSTKPFMVARFGSVETRAILNYNLKSKKTSDFKGILNHLSGKNNVYWKQNDKFLNELVNNAGFFPRDERYLEEFVQLIEDSSKNLDVLGVWNGMEQNISGIPDNTELFRIRDLEPWFFKKPWTMALEGKKVLVIHPFESAIKKQYKIKNELYINDVLPQFELKTIKAIQTLAGQKSEFENWFEALHFMKETILKTDFDTAIIGCGAYGFPLASFVKEIGKQAIHLGGVTQLLFGIKGSRWENWQHYTDLRQSNGKYWTSPSEEDYPKDFKKIENGCYW